MSYEYSSDNETGNNSDISINYDITHFGSLDAHSNIKLYDKNTVIRNGANTPPPTWKSFLEHNNKPNKPKKAKKNNTKKSTNGKKNNSKKEESSDPIKINGKKDKARDLYWDGDVEVVDVENVTFQDPENNNLIDDDFMFDMEL